MSSCNHTITQNDLDTALTSLRDTSSKGTTIVGNSTTVATKLVDDESEMVMSLYCPSCSAHDTVSKNATSTPTKWVITPSLGLNI
ncbi:hypothetical protein [Vibrio harveyi]